MTSQSELDLKGDFQTHPFAELLAEIATAKFFGSLRVERGDLKLIVYFDDGEVIFAVSNARKFRLFDILLRENRIDKEMLGKTPNFANDLELAAALKQSGVLTEGDVSEIFAKQVEGILAEALSWADGEWTFSALAKLRSGVRSAPRIGHMLAEYARGLSKEIIAPRFMSLYEMFELMPGSKKDIALEPQEELILARLTNTQQTLADLRFGSGLGESETLKVLYTLWLAGLALRKYWNQAFSERQVTTIRSATLKLARAATDIKKPKIQEETKDTLTPAVADSREEVKVISLDEYLEQVEKAETHYEILGTVPEAKLTQIRSSYFNLAKQFHPDRYHRSETEVLRRVENAFSKLAQAHETLRNPNTRTAYDNHLRNEARDKKMLGDTPVEVNVQGNQLHAERAVQEFEHGRSLLSDGGVEESLPFLARAVHLAQDVARYHAFYGKALSQTENGRHKAEAEMQAAVKLEPNNTTYRMMLAEFFVKMKLQKRAEGELARLLAITPDNKEAQSLLDSLRQK